MNSNGFFVENLVKDISPAYMNLRDIQEHEGYRRLIDAAWSEYQPYCPDEEFIKKTQSHFQGMMWQMYLTVFLLRKGAALAKSAEEGPDISLQTDSGPIYIEAVAVEKGVGKDAPVQFEDLPLGDLGEGVLMGPVVSEEFPNPKIIFRITNAIQNKRTQYAKWVKDQVIDPSRPFVIAVCAGSLDRADAPYASYGSRSVYGIGPTVMHIPLDREKRAGGIKSSIKFTPEHVKLSGQSVSADTFLTKATPEVSGILFTDMHLTRYINTEGKDFELIHNLTATNPLAARSLPVGYDVWVEQGENEFTLKSNRNEEKALEESNK